MAGGVGTRSAQPVATSRDALAVASFSLGVVGVVAVALAWVLSFTTVLDALAVREPLAWLALAAALLAPPLAVVLGAFGTRSSRRTSAMTGIALGVLGLLAIVAALAVAG